MNSIIAILLLHVWSGTDVYILDAESGLRFRNSVAPRVGIGVNSTVSATTFPLSIVFGAGNAYVSASGSATSYPEHERGDVSDTHTKTFTSWYGLGFGYIPGQFEYEVGDCMVYMAPAASLGIGYEKTNTVLTNMQVSGEAKLSSSYIVPQYARTRFAALAKSTFFISHRRLCLFIGIDTRSVVEVGLAVVM